LKFSHSNTLPFLEGTEIAPTPQTCKILLVRHTHPNSVFPELSSEVEAMHTAKINSNYQANEQNNILCCCKKRQPKELSKKP